MIDLPDGLDNRRMTGVFAMSNLRTDTDTFISPLGNNTDAKVDVCLAYSRLLTLYIPQCRLFGALIAPKCDGNRAMMSGCVEHLH